MPISEVYNCDCMEYMRSLPDKYFDLAVCDFPYGGGNQDVINGGGRFGQRFERYAIQPCSEGQICEIRNTPPYHQLQNGRGANNRFGGWFNRYEQPSSPKEGTIPDKAKNIADWDVTPPQEYFDEVFRVSKNVIHWGGNYFNLPPTRCFLVWEKETISEKFSMAMVEYAWTSFNGNAKLYKCRPQARKDEYPRFHPCSKPIELYSWIYKMFAKEGQKVYDPMLGGGNSRIAAYFANLDFYGTELNSYYFEKSKEAFDFACRGVRKQDDGKEIIQMNLFD